MGSIDSFLVCNDWVLDRTDEELEERNRELQMIENSESEDK